jgi:hypothetical protein
MMPRKWDGDPISGERKFVYQRFAILGQKHNCLISSVLQLSRHAWHDYCIYQPRVMNELKTGFLMLAVCVALFAQADPHFWGGLYQLVGRLFGAVH